MRSLTLVLALLFSIQDTHAQSDEPPYLLPLQVVINILEADDSSFAQLHVDVEEKVFSALIIIEDDHIAITIHHGNNNKLVLGIAASHDGVQHMFIDQGVDGKLEFSKIMGITPEQVIPQEVSYENYTSVLRRIDEYLRTH